MHFDLIFAGVTSAFEFANLIAIVIGVSLGILVGAIPGLSAPMAIAIAVPLTFYMGALPAVAFLLSVSKGGDFGGSISAILINTPGTPAAASTAIDGYPLAKQGKAGKAMKMALYASVTGDVFSDIILILVAAPLALIALKMGSPELLGVLLFSMTFIAALVGDSVLKGLFAASVGILIATVGLDFETGAERFTFGILELQDGIPIAVIGIGLLAMGEVLRQTELLYMGRKGNEEAMSFEQSKVPQDQRVSFDEYRQSGRTILRSAMIGTFIGAIPGLGQSLAGFMGYASARRASKTPEEFGTGKLEGVAACEAADSAVNGANLIPLLTLGIPGNASAALLIGAFLIHGVVPGPMVFQNQPVLIYGMFTSLMIASLANLVVGSLCLRIFAHALKIPLWLILPVVTLLCVTGAFISAGGMFGVGLMLIFAVVGYFCRKLGFSFIALLIGYILGPMFEVELRNTLNLLDGFGDMVNHPMLIIMIILSGAALWRLSGRRGVLSDAVG